MEHDIPFQTEYSAFQYSSSYKAKFDFYVDNKYFIEYDGETHYKSNLHGWHSAEQLSLQQERDAIKEKWAYDNDIHLYVIPYTEFDNLEEIIRDISKGEFDMNGLKFKAPDIEEAESEA